MTRVKHILPFSTKSAYGSFCATTYFTWTTILYSIFQPSSIRTQLMNASFAYFGLDTLFLLHRREWYYLPHHLVTLTLTAAVHYNLINPADTIHVLSYAEFSNILFGTWNLAKENRSVNPRLYHLITPYFAIMYVPLRTFGLPVIAWNVWASCIATATHEVFAIGTSLFLLVCMSWFYALKVVGITRKLLEQSNNTSTELTEHKAYNVFRRVICWVHVAKLHVTALYLFHSVSKHNLLNHILYYELFAHTPIALLQSMGFQHITPYANMSNFIKTILIARVSSLWVYTNLLLSFFNDESALQVLLTDIFMSLTALKQHSDTN